MKDLANIIRVFYPRRFTAAYRFNQERAIVSIARGSGNKWIRVKDCFSTPVAWLTLDARNELIQNFGSGFLSSKNDIAIAVDTVPYEVTFLCRGLRLDHVTLVRQIPQIEDGSEFLTMVLLDTKPWSR